MNVGVLLAAIIGAGCGYWFFVMHRQLLVSLTYDLRLIVDPAYREACLDVLENPNFHKTAKPEFNVIPRSEHYDALSRSRNTIDKTLRAYNKIIFGDLAKRIVLFCVPPLLLLTYFGVAPYFLAAAFVMLAAAIINEITFLHRPGFALHMRLSSLLTHSYADAGYRSRTAHNKDLVNKTTAQSVQAPITPPPFMQTMQQPTVVVQPFASDAYTQPLLPIAHLQPKLNAKINEDDDDIIIPSAKTAEPRKLSFSTIWWGIDALVCFGVVLNFWIADATTFMDVLLMPFVLVAMIQVFFVPMYFIVTIAQKLLKTAPKQTTL